MNASFCSEKESRDENMEITVTSAPREGVYQRGSNGSCQETLRQHQRLKELAGSLRKELSDGKLCQSVIEPCAYSAFTVSMFFQNFTLLPVQSRTDPLFYRRIAAAAGASGAVPLSTAKLTDYFLHQKSLDPAWYAKHKHSLRLYRKYRKSLAAREEQATHRPSVAPLAYTTVSELDSFFWEQNKKHDQRKKEMNNEVFDLENRMVSEREGPGIEGLEDQTQAKIYASDEFAVVPEEHSQVGLEICVPWFSYSECEDNICHNDSVQNEENENSQNSRGNQLPYVANLSGEAVVVHADTSRASEAISKKNKKHACDGLALNSATEAPNEGKEVCGSVQFSDVDSFLLSAPSFDYGMRCQSKEKSQENARLTPVRANNDTGKIAIGIPSPPATSFKHHEITKRRPNAYTFFCDMQKSLEERLNEAVRTPLPESPRPSFDDRDDSSAAPADRDLENVSSTSVDKQSNSRSPNDVASMESTQSTEVSLESYPCAQSTIMQEAMQCSLVGTNDRMDASKDVLESASIESIGSVPMNEEAEDEGTHSVGSASGNKPSNPRWPPDIPSLESAQSTEASVERQPFAKSTMMQESSMAETSQLMVASKSVLESASVKSTGNVLVNEEEEEEETCRDDTETDIMRESAVMKLGQSTNASVEKHAGTEQVISDAAPEDRREADSSTAGLMENRFDSLPSPSSDGNNTISSAEVNVAVGEIRKGSEVLLQDIQSNSTRNITDTAIVHTVNKRRAPDGSRFETSQANKDATTDGNDHDDLLEWLDAELDLARKNSTCSELDPADYSESGGKHSMHRARGSHRKSCQKTSPKSNTHQIRASRIPTAKLERPSNCQTFSPAYRPSLKTPSKGNKGARPSPRSVVLELDGCTSTHESLQTKLLDRPSWVSPSRSLSSPKTPLNLPEEKPEVCTLKWVPNLHENVAGCDWCLANATEEGKNIFKTRGIHYEVNRVRGGCSRSCLHFPRKETEPPVRLCQRCFYTTHIIPDGCTRNHESPLSKVSGRPAWVSPSRSLSSPRTPSDNLQEEKPGVCTSKWVPNLHGSIAGCELCLANATEEGRKIFEMTGVHYEVNRVRGGCSRSCLHFPRNDTEPPVRLCRRCFYSTHIIPDGHSQHFYQGDQKMNRIGSPRSDGLKKGKLQSI